MNKIKSVLILEDDALIRSDFVSQVTDFVTVLPNDWQGIMLGGQHHSMPNKLRDGLVKVNYAQRTHAYAARGDYLRGLYARWANATVHVDWLMNGWQSGFPVYAPERWLIGQARSRSDICGRTNATTFWNRVSSDEYGPVCLLRVPRHVMLELRELGFHTGYSLNAHDLDEGLVRVFTVTPPVEREGQLRRWLDVIQQECGQLENAVASVWHPEATSDLLRRAVGNSQLYEVVGETLGEALASLPPEFRPARGSQVIPKDPILVLDTNKLVIEELRTHGFHTGYWRDPISDVDYGLRQIFEGNLEHDDRAIKLREWCRMLRNEAANFGGIVVAWHPLASKDAFEEAGENALQISATTADEVVRQLRCSM